MGDMVLNYIIFIFNYELSLSHMKGQVRKLRKEPEVLREYDSVIKEQLASGVPHLAVIHKEASTTKLKVVYDASAKSGKESASLNHCLHKGQSLTPLLLDILLRF